MSAALFKPDLYPHEINLNEFTIRDLEEVTESSAITNPENEKKQGFITLPRGAAVGVMLIGGGLGFMMGGPLGAIVGAVVGLAVGYFAGILLKRSAYPASQEESVEHYAKNKTTGDIYKYNKTSHMYVHVGRSYVGDKLTRLFLEQ